ncbi:MAG: tetratricopeptide repeat protein [Planctomycetota bacterium]|jgi:Tfp pilus assembly protein PilF
MTDRIESIKKLLAAEPDDVFLNYSLAMEYVVAEQCEPALESFSRCIELDETYVPAYVEAGKCARSAGLADRARDYFTRALSLARGQGQNHVVDFVAQQLQSLPAADSSLGNAANNPPDGLSER